MREPALRALRAWLGDPEAPRLCVLTGSPGTGKSHLLAELSEADATSFDVRLSARGMTAAVLEWAVAGQLALPLDGLVTRLTADTRPATIAIGEFDETGPAMDGSACAEIIAKLLDPLLALGHVRLLVEGRPGSVDCFQTGATVLNLDAPAATDREAFAARLPDEAFPNVGTGLLGGATPEQWLNAQPEETLPALYALGFAAETLDRGTWLTLCTAITGDAAAAEESVAATAPVVARGDDAFALTSRTLRDAARRRAAPGSAAAIASALLGTVPQDADGRPDWASASPYVLRYLPYHGVTSVLADPHFLLAGDPVPITVAFGDGAGPEPLRETWLLAAPPLVAGAGRAERPALLRLAALRRGDEATAALFGEAQAEWEAVEARPHAAPAESAVLTPSADGRTRLVTGPREVAAITAEDGAALTAGASGTPRVSEPVDAAALIAVAESSGAELTALGAGDGLLLTGDRTGEVRAWPNAAIPSSAHLHNGPVTAVASLRTGPDSHVVVSGGADGAVRLWRLGEKPVAAPVERRDAPVSAVAAGSLSGGPAVAAAWVDGLVVIWDLESGRPDALRLGCLVRSVAFGPDDTLVVGGQHGVATIRFRPAVAWPDLRQANPDQANPDRTDDPVRADVNRTDPGRADVDRTDPGRAEGADFERAE